MGRWSVLEVKVVWRAHESVAEVALLKRLISLAVRGALLIPDALDNWRRRCVVALFSGGGVEGLI
ncbi:MAG: hypothetical protein M2R45_03367 [Verrucomicrobia subdivision 3 bacterium]|nr:hypothetical protein [Limisphaerales bacterium]MCS1416720.1 hypothetical protein [Limisphaerales bacterium]